MFICAICVTLFKDRTGLSNLCTSVRSVGLFLRAHPFIKIKFRQVLLNQYLDKNTLKAIINKVAPMGERNDFRNEFHGFLRPVLSFFFFCLVVSIKKCIFAAIKMFFLMNTIRKSI